MAKSVSAPAKPASSDNSYWLSFVLIGLCGVLVGATGMYFALLPKLQRTAPTPAATAASDPTTHVPSPELTTGQTPAQADRTLGNFYYDHQNWPLAVRHYESAIRLGSDDADIRTDLGNAYRFAGRTDEALAQYQLAQRMNPAHEFSLFNQGGLYLEQLNQPQKAVEVWNQYLARFPQGRNVEAARQLIAQAQSGLPGLTPPPAPGAKPPSPEAQLLNRPVPGKP